MHKRKNDKKKFWGKNKSEKNIRYIVHSDVVSPVVTPVSHDREKYFVTFIDDFSDFICVYMIKGKNEVTNYFKEYTKLVQSKCNTKISVLRCDNGGEYISREFKEFCAGKKTFIDYTTPYTLQLNEKSERYN